MNMAFMSLLFLMGGFLITNAQSAAVPSNFIKSESNPRAHLSDNHNKEEVPFGLDHNSESLSKYEANNDIDIPFSQLDDQKEGDESSMNRDNYMTSISELRSRLSGLHKNLQNEKKRKDEARNDFHKALTKRNSIATKAQDIAEERRALEKDLFEARTLASEHEYALRMLKLKAGKARESIKSLDGRKRDVLRQTKHIVDDFQHHGLEHWVSSSLNGSSPFLRGAFVQGAATFVEPMFNGLERLVDVNNQVSSSIPNQFPYVGESFYAGVITYLVILTPLVLAISAALRIKRNVTRLSTGHIIVLGNSYFGLLSLGCFSATTVMSVDVIRTLWTSRTLILYIVMMSHTFMFLFLFSAHLLAALRSQHNIALVHVLMQFLVGFHFVLHSIGHSVPGETSHVHKAAYAVYAMVFGFILFQLCWQRAELESLLNEFNIERRFKGMNDNYIPIDKPLIITFGRDLNEIPHANEQTNFDLVSEQALSKEGNTCHIVSNSFLNENDVHVHDMRSEQASQMMKGLAKESDNTKIF